MTSWIVAVSLKVKKNNRYPVGLLQYCNQNVISIYIAKSIRFLNPGLTGSHLDWDDICLPSYSHLIV